MMPLTWRNLFTISSYKHGNCPTLFILQFGIMFPLLFWNLLTITCYNHCSCTTIIILYIRFVIPLLWRNNTIASKSHSNSPTTRNNIWIMIIFFIRQFLFIICLYKCHSIIYSILTFLEFWILILLILPLFRNFKTIIPKIITYSITIIIFFILISFFIFRNNSLFS